MRSIYQLLREVVESFWWLRPHLRPGRWLLGSVILCAFVSAPLEVAGVGLLLPMLTFLRGDDAQKEALLRGRFLHHLKEAFPDGSYSFYFALLCGLIVLAIVGKNIVLYIGANLSATLLSRSSDNLRRSLFDRIQTAPLRVFEQHKAGEIAAVFTAETVRTTNAMDFMVGFFQRSCIGLMMLVTMFFLSWQVSVAFMLLVLLIGAMTGFLHRRIKVLGARRSELYLALSGRLIETFGGMRVVRVTHSLDHQAQQFSEISGGIGQAERRATRAGGGLGPATEILGVTGAMLILIGTYHWLIVPGKMPSGELLILGFLLIRLLPLVSQLHGFTGQLAYNLAGAREVMRWLKTERYPMRPFGSRTFDGLKTGLRLVDLTYDYANGKRALDGVNLEVPAGQTVALVGASGSGKSTLASLLIRLREPTSGRIEADGVDYWEFSPESWHGGLGVVEQEAFLFHDTVRQNICIGAATAPQEDIDRALRTANLAETVQGLPKGLETVVGERGTMLSGGQKQRLAIARALVRKPRLLVLDEATSALDNVSERQVQAALDAAREGRTSVVIAHRLSTIRNADRIVVLEAGRVVQQGTWSELEQKPGAFQDLLRAAHDGHLAEPEPA